MKYEIKLRIAVSLLIINLSVGCFAQSFDSTAVTTTLHKNIKFDGVIKAKFETSANDGSMRFNIRNSRLGLRGNIGEYVSYRMQVELSNEGAFAPLDLYGTLKLCKGLSIRFGQQHIPFDNQYIISPAEMMFANRAFVGKYFTPGSRDIGAVARYKFPFNAFPLEGEVGIFNGGKINNPRWTNHPSYVARLTAGSMDGFRTSTKIYRYNDEKLFWGIDLHYANESLRVEAEVMNRTRSINTPDLFGAYIQGTYTFDFKTPKIFHNFSPAFRWDTMAYDVIDTGLDVNRLTFGINFGLDVKPFESTLRINYEQYLGRNNDFAEFKAHSDYPHVSENKVTIELLLRF